MREWFPGGETSVVIAKGNVPEQDVGNTLGGGREEGWERKSSSARCRQYIRGEREEGRERKKQARE